MGHRQHGLGDLPSVSCAVCTLSDTRDASTDASGAFILRSLRRAGHPVVDYRILEDKPRRIVSHLKSVATRREARALILTGGTGITRRDSTYEAIARLLEKRLEGFGEIFRALSFRKIGAAAMLSRAVAGTYRGLVVFSLPGSIDAVRLGMTQLILPVLPHAAGLVARGSRRGRHARAH
jgi:molybdopterin adenylyltransferase